MYRIKQFRSNYTVYQYRKTEKGAVSAAQKMANPYAIIESGDGDWEPVGIATKDKYFFGKIYVDALFADVVHYHKYNISLENLLITGIIKFPRKLCGLCNTAGMLVRYGVAKHDHDDENYIYRVTDYAYKVKEALDEIKGDQTCQS